MIFKEVAIEPAYLSTWDRVRLVVGQCGFQHGRLISDFPKSKWLLQVFESCRNCPPVDKKRIEESLSKTKAQLIRSGRHFEERDNWITNAKREHALRPFHVVVTSQPHPGYDEFIEGDEIYHEHGKWKTKTDAVIPRTAEAIANVARELLQQSKEVLFVDPHFEPKAAYSKTLCRLVEFATAGKALNRLEYHLKHASTKEHFKSKLGVAILPFLKQPLPITLRFIRWQSLDDLVRDAMHPRYILTELVGLRYDWGLGEGKDGESTDVQIVPAGGEVYNQRWADFCATSTRFQFVDGFEISSSGVRDICVRQGKFEPVY